MARGSGGAGCVIVALGLAATVGAYYAFRGYEPKLTPEELDRRVRADEEAAADRRSRFQAAQAAQRAEPAKEASSPAPSGRPVIATLDTLEEMQAVYARMSSAERAAAMREACAAGCDPVRRKAIVDAAPASERAMLERLAEQITAEREQRYRARQAQERARENAGRVCCCDGTVSPTCRTVHRGCCSGRDGVCACR